MPRYNRDRQSSRSSSNGTEREPQQDRPQTSNNMFPIFAAIFTVVIGGLMILDIYNPNLIASVLGSNPDLLDKKTELTPSPTVSPTVSASPTPTPSPTSTPTPEPKIAETPNQETSKLQPTEIFQKFRPAVVMIYSGLSQGSGVIAEPSGTIVTNEHVVRGQTQVKVKSIWGKYYDGTVTAVNADIDLAIVKIQSDRVLSCVPFDTSPVVIGQTVYALSNPLGMESTFTNGIVSRVEGNGDVIHTTAIAPGSSGSPLLNEYGKAIAINKAVRRDIAISISTPVAAIANLTTKLICP